MFPPWARQKMFRDQPGSCIYANKPKDLKGFSQEILNEIQQNRDRRY